MSQNQVVRGRSTSVYIEQGHICVRYHQTKVASISPTSTMLNSGGYRTVTTKLRMNQAANQYDLGYQVYQKDFGWFVALDNGEVQPYEDYMCVPRKELQATA